jgi:NAD(P)-dependent dehydrogenase (short-subunit alcohol dehydrogenase family)
MQNQFEGKVALVTGAASGLGKATAIMFAARGAKVVVSDMSVEAGEQVVADINAKGGEAIFVACNVTKEDEVNALVSKTVSHFGKLDYGINNAGIGGLWTPTHKYPTDNFEQVMAVNSTGVFFCMRAEIQQMLAQGFGSIVNVSSVSGLVGFPNNLAYATSKHAVIGLTKTAALEYAKKGIRVNAVCPVFTITPLVEGMFEFIGDFKDKLEAAIPMKRFGQPDEVAETIVWLSSDAASFITGHALPIDGGMVAS